jgi:hypothetical protein
MPYGLMLGGIILVFVILGIIVHKQHKREIAQIRADATGDEKYYQQLIRDNEVLRSYMDNKHMVFSDHTKEIINKRPMDPDIVVLISAVDLYDLTQKQWRDGYDMASTTSGKAMQMRYGVDNQVEDDDGVVKMRASFADKRFDNDFAKLVNAITAIGVSYGQTQQLRDRISQQIISFRMYLAKKQRGERVDFPKT